MKNSLSRRSLVRFISFSTAAVLLLAGTATQQYLMASDYRMQLENTYVRSLGELSTYLTNISSDLDKGKYVGTPGQLSLLSARLWRESSGAKSALSTLPVSELHLDGTYKFLSQAGDYAMSLSKKVSSGGSLTDEERQNAEALRQYAGKLRDYVSVMEEKIRGGQISVEALRASQYHESAGSETEGTKVSGVAAGFKDVEQTMTGYPTLIYDGPFSDHLLSQKPRLTRYLPVVAPEDAQRAAAQAAGVNASELTRGDDENSNMPSYTFTAGGISVGVTKAGGLATYMINSRDIGSERLARDMLLRRGAQYLEVLGIKNMRATYYETQDGICTINFASSDGDVILYTDLIKVGVALDDGAIVFYDARGYISNHQTRELPAPQITAEQAAQSLSPLLAVDSVRLALIPTSGKNEVLTYEFQTHAIDGSPVSDDNEGGAVAAGASGADQSTDGAGTGNPGGGTQSGTGAGDKANSENQKRAAGGNQKLADEGAITYSGERAKTQDSQPQRLLVYVNVETGAEEQIFLLLETPGGVMTK